MLVCFLYFGQTRPNPSLEKKTRTPHQGQSPFREGNHQSTRMVGVEHDFRTIWTEKYGKIKPNWQGESRRPSLPARPVRAAWHVLNKPTHSLPDSRTRMAGQHTEQISAASISNSAILRSIRWRCSPSSGCNGDKTQG